MKIDNFHKKYLKYFCGNAKTHTQTHKHTHTHTHKHRHTHARTHSRTSAYTHSRTHLNNDGNENEHFCNIKIRVLSAALQFSDTVWKLNVYEAKLCCNFVLFPCVGECKSTKSGLEYRGTMSKTKNGYTCQAWSSQTPNKHSRTPQRYPSAGLVSNFCRNPDDDTGGPWCYTTSANKRWEYCGVQMCGKHSISNLPVTLIN